MFFFEKKKKENGSKQRKSNIIRKTMRGEMKSVWCDFVLFQFISEIIFAEIYVFLSYTFGFQCERFGICVFVKNPT